MSKPPALMLPLNGRHWIEASAGTGKTFTLSLLVLRLLLERELALPNILAVTFTNAATEELKIKIRGQIKLALDLLKPGLPEDLAGLDSGKRITAELLQSLTAEKTSSHLLYLLDQALQDCDRASIFTIHGFCSRVLANHALNAGQVLQAPGLLTNTVALNTKIAFDIWREFSTDRELMRSLFRLWPTPELLAKQCESLLQAEHVLPEAPATLPEGCDMPALTRRLRNAVELHLETAREILLQASAQGALSLSNFKPEQIRIRFDNLAEWYALDNDETLDDPDFSWLSMRFILSKIKKTWSEKNPNPEPPISPLFEAIEQWYDGLAQQQSHEVALDILCLHRVRERLRSRRDTQLQKLQQYTYDDLITQVLRALESESGGDLCEDLRKEYPVALVDEFQDTDSQQWKIFSALYPENPAGNTLYLIGDPKQAIYGFRGGDVHAYLSAKLETSSHWNLPENFRSRPSLLSAVETLFDQAGENAFREPDIRFFPVHSGGTVQDSDFLYDDKPLHAMEIALLPEPADPAKPLPMPKAHEFATRACVEKIHELLIAGQQKTALLKDRETGEIRPLRSGDIAVLVNKNAEAVQIQAALFASGIASVISSRKNLFSTAEAREVFIILDALIDNRDQARWCGALSTVLLGYHAGQIKQLESDDVAASRSADLAAQYREHWFSQGVLSLFSQLCADAAPRLLPLADGERRLSNYLQLAESLQQAVASTLGPEHCLRWLGQAMQDSGNDEENMLRLDSDQKRVKILTLHKSKGLEFPLVFMPFANFGKKLQSGGSGLALLNYHEQHRRITHALLYGKSNEDFLTAIKAAASEEQLAEQVRLFYVGLTRAQYYCWVCSGSVNEGNTSGLTSVLFRNGKDEIIKPVRTDFLRRLEAIGERNPTIVIESISDNAKQLPRFKDEVDSIPITTSDPSPHIQLDWRVLSFSQMTHGSHQGPGVTAAADEAEPANAELSAADEVFDRRFSGIAFGNALHQVLENTRADAWASHAPADTAPASELPLLHQALLRHGYLPDELETGSAQLAPLVFNTLRARLPEGVRLCDLPEKARLNEMEFHFSLRDCDSRQLLEVLKAQGVLQQREDFPSLRRLSGLMTGKIDLTYRHEGRFYICDYKSNRLPAYDVEHCLQAMRNSEYDFQALIYTLALHRWCKFRLRSDYAYEKHIGGIRYLFCRGLNAERQDGAGIVAMRFELALIEQLELLLHPLAEQTA